MHCQKSAGELNTAAKLGMRCVRDKWGSGHAFAGILMVVLRQFLRLWVCFPLHAAGVVTPIASFSP